MRTEPTSPYVLGTGLSHDGSAVLLRDGEIVVGIEKERLTRQKHDGGNDSEAVDYCLAAAGITLDDVDLVVQCELFHAVGRDEFDGPRPFAGRTDPPIVTISHHLAHAYSAIGTCPFDDFDVLVVDGCGSPRGLCTEPVAALPPVPAPPKILAEKDSFYRWHGGRLEVLAKDFSEMERPWLHDVRLPTTRHSIGGFYATVSRHCFRTMSDAGKLMGLAPHGRRPALDDDAFEWVDDRLLVRDGWKNRLGRPARDHADFMARFDEFAEVALWAQQQVESAVGQLVARRTERFGTDKLAYTGGVALNAVANGRLLSAGTVDSLHIEPAAGDDGIALGCAFYGWLEVLGRPRAAPDPTTCFGRRYDRREMQAAVEVLPADRYAVDRGACADAIADRVAAELAGGAIVGWFVGGSEFGPRALGRRSILAHPGLPGLHERINRDVKRREDFRPFAPAVRADDVATYFVNGWPSPYMILVDEVRPEWRERLSNVTHVDGSARVQTVDPAWNPEFHDLIGRFRCLTGTGVLLNTSFNRRGEPIVERPEEAIALFGDSAIDLLVLDDVVVTKR